MQNEELYPKDFQEFLTQFKSEDDCWDYIFQMRWPDGYICSKCKSNKYGLHRRKSFIVLHADMKLVLLEVLFFTKPESHYCFGFI